MIRHILFILLLISFPFLFACSSNQPAINQPRFQDGLAISTELKSIIKHKPAIATNGSMEATKLRNHNKLNRLLYLNKNIQLTPLTGTTFNRDQQLNISKQLTLLEKYRVGAEETALLTQRIYQRSIRLYQCNSNLLVEVRSVDPNANQLPPLLQLNNEIQTIKLNMYDFNNSEFKAWSQIRATEINLISLESFWQAMDSKKQSMFYLSLNAQAARNILNNCRYLQQKIDKDLQDILFNYDSLSGYNRALKRLRKLLGKESIPQ